MAFTNNHTTFQVKLDGQKNRPLVAERSVKTVNDDHKIYLHFTGYYNYPNNESAYDIET